MAHPIQPAVKVPWDERDDAISVQLAIGFGTVSTVAVLLCVALMLLLLRVGDALEDVRSDARAAQDALTLSLSVREHYLHEAHTVIQRDDTELVPHEGWLQRLQERARDLAARVPATEREHLETLVSESEALDHVFQREVLPAALAGEHEALGAAHERAEAHTQRASDAADAVVSSLEERMRAAQRRAQEATQLAMIAGCGGVLAILVLAIVFSMRIRRAIILPLQELAAAARRFGRGEFEPPVGDVGRGEIRIVARAFDAMAEELRARERALVRSERLAAVGQLAAGVAHEINNPVAVIRGYLKTMIPEARDEEQENELAILDQEAAACQRIVEDLLSYGRDPSLNRERLDPGALLVETVGRFEATEIGAQVRVTCDAEPGDLQADRVRLRQVLDNLLTNAALFAGDSALIQVSGQPTEDGGYRIEIADGGPGIPDGERESVFEPFRTSRPGGTGLGLAVSRIIVRAHAGRIEAHPREGGGTVMRVELPPPEEES